MEVYGKNKFKEIKTIFSSLDQSLDQRITLTNTVDLAYQNDQFDQDEQAKGKRVHGVRMRKRRNWFVRVF